MSFRKEQAPQDDFNLKLEDIQCIPHNVILFDELKNSSLIYPLGRNKFVILGMLKKPADEKEDTSSFVGEDDEKVKKVVLNMALFLGKASEGSVRCKQIAPDIKNILKVIPLDHDHVAVCDSNGIIHIINTETESRYPIKFESRVLSTIRFFNMKLGHVNFALRNLHLLPDGRIIQTVLPAHLNNANARHHYICRAGTDNQYCPDIKFEFEPNKQGMKWLDQSTFACMQDKRSLLGVFRLDEQGQADKTDLINPIWNTPNQTANGSYEVMGNKLIVGGHRGGIDVYQFNGESEFKLVSKATIAAEQLKQCRQDWPVRIVRLNELQFMAIGDVRSRQDSVASLWRLDHYGSITETTRFGAEYFDDPKAVFSPWGSTRILSLSVDINILDPLHPERYSTSKTHTCANFRHVTEDGTLILYDPSKGFHSQQYPEAQDLTLPLNSGETIAMLLEHQGRLPRPVSSIVLAYAHHGEEANLHALRIIPLGARPTIAMMPEVKAEQSCLNGKTEQPTQTLVSLSTSPETLFPLPGPGEGKRSGKSSSSADRKDDHEAALPPSAERKQIEGQITSQHVFDILVNIINDKAYWEAKEKWTSKSASTTLEGMRTKLTELKDKKFQDKVAALNTIAISVSKDGGLFGLVGTLFMKPYSDMFEHLRVLINKLQLQSSSDEFILGIDTFHKLQDDYLQFTMTNQNTNKA